jgi:hypothetical protein
MDLALEKAVDEILAQDGVKGVLMADANGLCVIAKGIANPSSSGYLTSMVNRAVELDSEEPVICVESDEHHIFVRKQDELVIAVYKASN